MRQQRIRRQLRLELLMSGVLLVAMGCGETVPPDPYAVVLMCERPDEIDLSQIGEFQLLFDGVDPRSEVPTLQTGGSVHITGALLLKQELQDAGEGLDLVIGFRPIVDGAADWSISPCDLPGRVEWRVGNRTSRHGGELVSMLDKNRTVRMGPGEYDLRFYAIKENVLTDELPTVYHIGRGRMRVIVAADGSPTT